MKTWITADTHFGHNNIIKYCDRPFFSVWDMDETLIRNWNRIVASNDVVYHLGDFSLKKSVDEYLSQLNGQIKLVPGGHDYWIRHVDLEEYKGKVEILPLYKTISVLRKKVVLCHYPMLSWDSSFHGSIHLHGHTHGKLPDLGRRADVGVDCNNFDPFDLEGIIENLMFLNGEK
jgi:calcineurin-like phosphoesterase family protein